MKLSELNTSVNTILEDIGEIKKCHSIELDPYHAKIKELNHSFLDSLLVDKNKTIIKVGDIIQHSNGKEFKVLNRSQQYVLQFIGNAQLEVLKIGNKKPIKIHYRELKEYFIK